MPRRTLRGSVLLVPLLIACGSSGDGDLFQGGAGAAGAASTAGGGATGGEAGAPVTATGGGGSDGSGGAPGGGGGAGGSGAGASTGGTTGGGGVMTAGAGGVPPASGGMPLTDDGGVADPEGGAPQAQLPTGLILSQACAECASQNCPDEVAACTADPKCVQGVECLNTCVLPPVCGACFVFSGVLSIPEPIPALNTCAAQACPMCPTLG